MVTFSLFYRSEPITTTYTAMSPPNKQLEVCTLVVILVSASALVLLRSLFFSQDMNQLARQKVLLEVVN